MRLLLQRIAWHLLFGKEYPFCTVCRKYCGCSHNMHEQKNFDTKTWMLMCRNCMEKHSLDYWKIWKDIK